MGVGGQRHASAALPPGQTRYRLYRRLGGPQGRSGRVRKMSPPQGFDPRTVQPVAIRYTDRVIPDQDRNASMFNSRYFCHMVIVNIFLVSVLVTLFKRAVPIFPELFVNWRWGIVVQHPIHVSLQKSPLCVFCGKNFDTV